MTASRPEETSLLGIELLPLADQLRMAANRKPPPRWQRDPNLRTANPYGRAITYVSDVGVFDVVERYLIAKPYADWRAARPAPSYGYYEDDFCRVVFQYIEPDDGSFAVGRTDIAVEDRPPTYSAEAYLRRFGDVPLASVPQDAERLAVIRRRIIAGLAQSRWPSGDGPAFVRDAAPGEIIQTEDKA